MTPPSVFWPLWTVVACADSAMWVYGELGTISSAPAPYAPLAWVVSGVVGIWVGCSFAERLCR